MQIHDQTKFGMFANVPFELNATKIKGPRQIAKHMFFLVEQFCELTGTMSKQVHYIHDIGSVIFVPALEIWVTDHSNVSIWIPVVERPFMPRDMYEPACLHFDDERRSGSILYTMQQCILADVETGSLKLQTP